MAIERKGASVPGAWGCRSAGEERGRGRGGFALYVTGGVGSLEGEFGVYHLGVLDGEFGSQRSKRETVEVGGGAVLAPGLVGAVCLVHGDGGSR